MICHKWWIKWQLCKNNPIKFILNPIELSFNGYSDAFILVTGYITVVRGNATTKVAFKNCTPFKNFTTEKNNVL